MSTIEELQTAVLVSLDPTTEPLQREHALAYCQSVRASSNGWAFALQSLTRNVRPEVAFWCLQVVYEVITDPSRYPCSMSPQQLEAIRSTLLSYLSQIVYPEQFPHSQQTRIPRFLYNKAAALVVALLAADYPHAWPDAFRACVLTLVIASPEGAQKPSITYNSVFMFFRILRALDDFVTSIRAAQLSDVHRSTSVRVKDAMREDCIAKIVDVCTGLLREPEFACHALDILGRYIEWVDVSLIVRSSILTPLYEAIISTKECKWRGAAAACLRSIVLKRMDLNSKAQLMRTLNIDTLIGAIRADVIVENDEGSVDSGLNLQGGHVEVAGLINILATTALNIMKSAWKANSIAASSVDPVSPELAQYVASVAQRALPVALQFLDEDTEDGTGAQTLECVTSYVNVYGQASQEGNGMTNAESMTMMCKILMVVEERGRFAADIDPTDENSERTRVFCELKNVLVKKVFTSVARLFCGLCVDFVKALYTKAREAGDISRLELGLSMVVALTGVGGIGGDSNLTNELYAYIIATPPKCLDFSVVQPLNGGTGPLTIVQIHQLELVSRNYFEIVGRCSKILLGKGDAGLLSGVLNIIFDGRGLGHLSSEAVRSHAAHALVKIAKPLRGVISLEHVETAVQAAQGHVFPVEEDIESQRWKNQMVIFETVGYLLGTDQNRDGSVRLVFAMLKPIVEGLNSLGGGMRCVSYIAAAGYLSKGFGGDSKVMSVNTGKEGDKAVVEDVVKTNRGMGKDMLDVWIWCIDAVVKVGWASFRVGDEKWLPEMRMKLLFFLHRMVDTVGPHVIPYLKKIGEPLLKWGLSGAELKEMVSLMSQSAIKFREQFEVVAVMVHVPIVQHMERASFSMNSRTLMVVSEGDREALDVLKACLYWVNVVSGCGLIDILIRPEQQQVILTVMQKLVLYAVCEDIDVRVAGGVMRTAWMTLGRMIGQWGNRGNEGLLKGFDDFVFKEVVEAMVWSAVKSVVFRSGDYNSGQALSVMNDVVKVQRVCAKQYGGLFTNELYKVLTGHAISISQQDCIVYVQQLNSKDANDALVCSSAWSGMMQRVRSKRC